MGKELLKPATVRNAKPGETDKRINDGRGLYLLVKTTVARMALVCHENPSRTPCALIDTSNRHP